jgi:hypothetical protein
VSPTGEAVEKLGVPKVISFNRAASKGNGLCGAVGSRRKAGLKIV